MKFHVPIKLPSLANTRLHWRSMAALKKRQRLAVYCQMVASKGRGEMLPKLPHVITITRVGPRKLDDDNLAAACKYVRDQIAAIVGVDDGSPMYTWRYAQRTGPYGVDVQIETRSERC